MKRHAVADYFPIQNIQCSEECGCAMTFIVVRKRATPARFHRQSWLSSIESLDLTLFIHAQYECLFRRVHVQAHHVTQFFDELRVAAEFEGFGQMWLEVVMLPNPAHRRFTQPLSSGHCSRTPMRRIRGFGVQCRLNDGLYFFRRNSGQATRPRSIFFQSGQTKRQEALPPQLHRWSGNVQLFGDVLAQYALGGHANNLSPLNQPRGNAPSARPRVQSGLFFRRQHNRRCASAHETHRKIPESISKVINDALH